MVLIQRSLGITRYRAVATAVAVGLAGGALLYLLTGLPLAHLVGHFNISWAVAWGIVNLIAEGSWVIAVFYPWIIPVEATVDLIIAISGLGVAAGW
jgi:hypothetical protein